MIQYYIVYTLCEYLKVLYSLCLLFIICMFNRLSIHNFNDIEGITCVNVYVGSITWDDNTTIVLLNGNRLSITLMNSTFIDALNVCGRGITWDDVAG